MSITQPARDAAADHLQSRSDDGHTFNAIRRGQCDNHSLVQAFQRAIDAAIRDGAET